MENVKTKVRAKLWTKDFTIITVGSFISMLGFTVTGFAFSLMVFDKTNSTFLYAFMMVASVFPQIFVPIFAGAVLDRKSRRKTIYTIDFIFSLVFISVTLIVNFDYFNYWVYLAIIIFVGVLNAVYLVAYDSYYPNLISENNFSKAYAISSLLYPIANTVMVPVAGWAYEVVGIVPLFAFASVTSFITATVETFVKGGELHLLKSKEELSKKEKVSPMRQFTKDLKFGLSYINGEKGLKTITAYFIVTMASGAVLSALFLPYLKINLPTISFKIFSLNVVWHSTMLYSIIMGVNTLGRIIGGIVHYLRKITPKYKYVTALSVYIIITVLDGLILFMPYWWLMVIFQMVSGMFAVTSFNIRISATQNYIPDTVRARFNGTFTLLVTLGSVIGQLIGGALGEILDSKWIVLVAMAINMVAIFLIIYKNRKYVKPIYNCDI